MDKPDELKYGRLKPIKFHSTRKYSGQTRQLWEFLCDCGSKIVAIRSSVLSGHTKSCGCLALECKQKHRESNAMFIREA